jgi:2-haloacid dehalogenase
MGAEPKDIAGDIAALTVDTGGTVLDWYTGIVGTLEAFGAAAGVAAPWPEVAKSWRRKSTGMVDRGMPMADGRATLDMDDVLRITQEEVWRELGLPAVSAEAQRRLILAWRDLDPWPDVPVALPRLRKRFVVAPFTILTTALIVAASRRAGLDWDLVISCEMIGIYKTERPAYETAARWLGLPHERILMVTGHNNDLRAAHSYGFRTAFIHRPRQWGDEPPPDPDPDPRADLVCADFADLADQLGCPR